MTIFYSPSNLGFFDTLIHGEIVKAVPDPNWSRPFVTREVEEDGQLVAKEVPDMEAIHPTITVPNPDCKIPDDAISITNEEHQALLIAQAQGKVIQPNYAGRPKAVDFVPSTEELQEQAAATAKQELDHSDVVFIRCGKAGVQWPAEWQTYVQALRLIASGAELVTELPARPDYPAGA